MLDQAKELTFPSKVTQLPAGRVVSAGVSDAQTSNLESFDPKNDSHKSMKRYEIVTIF